MQTKSRYTTVTVCSCLLVCFSVVEPASASAVSVDKSTLSIKMAYNNLAVNAGRNNSINRGVNNTRDRGANRGLNVGNDAGINANPAVKREAVNPTVNEYNSYYGVGGYNNNAAAAAAIAVPGTYCSRQCVANIAPSWATYCLLNCL